MDNFWLILRFWKNQVPATKDDHNPFSEKIPEPRVQNGKFRTVVGRSSDGRRTVVGRPSDGPTAVPGRRPSRFFPSGGLGAAAPRVPGGFGGAGGPPIGGVWKGFAPPAKERGVCAAPQQFFLKTFTFARACISWSLYFRDRVIHRTSLYPRVSMVGRQKIVGCP